MKQGINLTYLSKTIGVEMAAKLLSQAGFQYLDYTPKTAEAEAEAKALLPKYGLSVYQTHAPFNRYSRMTTEAHRKAVWDTLAVTASLGAKYMVAHGDEFDFANIEYTPEKALAYNYDYFAPVVEEAKKLGVRVAFENVFEDSATKPRFCSKAEDLAALIDRFGDETVCACWDTGHAAVSFKEEQPKAIALLGKRIECTHIHDNYMEDDSHLIPFIGKMDWTACMAALKAHTQTEVLSLELVYGSIPEGMAAEYAALVSKACAELMNIGG